MITEAVHFLPQASAPPRKATRGQVYVKNDGKLYFVNPSGVEQPVAMLTGESIDLSAVWPVGSIFMAAVSTNPATLLGFGTWARFGQGRMPISQDGGDVDFDTAEETGGNKTITQTTSQMPTHTHVQDSHNHTQNAHLHGITVGSGAGDDQVLKGGGSFATRDTGASTATNIATTATNQNAGSGTPMNIMPPYIVTYMWKRTA